MFKFTDLFLLTLALSAGLFAQQKADPVKEPPDAVKAKSDAVQKAMAGGATSPGEAVDPNTYVLGPEDVIFVNVWHDQDFTSSYLIRPDGKISMVLVGEFDAAGLTPKQLGQSITERLSSMIKDPQVDVRVLQVNSKYYIISGEVNKAGRFPMATKTRVFEALANAGGFRDFAKKKKIVIIRGAERIKFNWDEVVKGKRLEQDVYLESGDQIVVP